MIFASKSCRHLIVLILLVALTAIAFPQGRPEVVWARAGHSASVSAIAYSPDGLTFATSSGDATIKVWSADGKFLRSFSLPFDPNSRVAAFTSVAFSHDGALLAAGVHQTDGTQFGDFGTVQVWRLSDGQIVQSITGFHYMADSVSFSPSGLLAVGSDGTEIQVWNPVSGVLVASIDNPDACYQVAFSPNGQWLAASTLNKSVKLFRTSDWSLQRTLSGQTGDVIPIAFSPDGTQIAAGSSDQTIRLWNVSSGSFIRSINQVSNVISVAFAPGGQTLAAGGVSGAIKFWNPQNGALTRTLSGPIGAATAMAYSPDGQTLTSSNYYPSTSITQWNVSLGTQIRTVNAQAGAVWALAATPSLQIMSVADTSVRFCRLADGAPVRTIDTAQNLAIAALSPNGQLVATPGPSNSISIYRTSDGALIQTLTGHTRSVTGLAFSHDGKMLASGAAFDTNDYKVKLWRVSDWTLIGQLPAPSAGAFSDLDFSPDNAMLSSTWPGGTLVWRVSDGALLRTFDGGSHARFSPNGQWIVVCSEYVHVYRTADWALIGSLSDQNQAAVFSPDSRYLVLGGPRQIEFWRMSDGTLQQIYDQEVGPPGLGVISLTFSRDGREFAYGRTDATVIVAKNPFGILPVPTPGLRGG